MPTYRYESKNAAGKGTSGVLSAANLTAASTDLRNRGEYILALAPVDEGKRKGGAGFSLTFGPGAKDVQAFTSQLAVMIRAGISIRAAIEGISEQVQNPKFKTMLVQMKRDVESGKQFSDALMRYPKVFSPLYINMVRAGEAGGSDGAEARGLRFRQLSVGRDDGERRVLQRAALEVRFKIFRRHFGREADPAEFLAHFKRCGPEMRTIAHDHAAAGIHRDQGADDMALRGNCGSRPCSAFEIERRGSETGACRPQVELFCGGGCRGITEIAIGRETPPSLVSAVGQVKQHRRAHHRHAHVADRKAATLLA